MTTREYEKGWGEETMRIVCPHCYYEIHFEFPKEAIDQSDGELIICGDQDCPFCEEYISIELTGETWTEGNYTGVTVKGYKEKDKE